MHCLRRLRPHARHRAFRYQEFGVCELSFSSYLRVTDSGASLHIRIPAFAAR